MNLGNRNFHAPLAMNQCAFCREEGHWKRDCPKYRSAQHEAARTMGLDE